MPSSLAPVKTLPSIAKGTSQVWVNVWAHLIRADSDVFFFFYSWVIVHCVYIPQFLYPFICPWIYRLLPCSSYCKKCCNSRVHVSQYCVGFWHPSTRISHRYTHVPSLLNLPPTSLPIPPLVTEYWAELPGSHSKFPPAVYLTWGSGYAPMLVSQLAPPSPSPTVSTVCSLRLHLHCCPANRNISTIFLDSIHMC